MGNNDEERATAYHEAGHSVGACLVRLPVQNVTIVPTSNFLGRCSYGYDDVRPDKDDRPKITLRTKRMMFAAAAGSIAGELFLGKDILKSHWDDVLLLAGQINGSQEAANLYAQFMWQQAIDAIAHDWECVHAVADALLERHTLGSRKIRDLIRRASRIGEVPTIELL
jgi:ATP-dependent Zn protease